jgi:hypothetical protein
MPFKFLIALVAVMLAAIAWAGGWHYPSFWWALAVYAAFIAWARRIAS